MPMPKHVTIDVQNSTTSADLFHFKVMELKTFEDDKNAEGSQCRVRFHFLFDLIRKQKDDALENFDWDVDSTP
jgi:hypothetical protein